MFTLFECTVYCNVMLGPSFELLGQLTKQGRLHTKLHWSLNYMTSLLNWREYGWSCLCCASHLTRFSVHPHINRDQVNFRLKAKKKIMEIKIVAYNQKKFKLALKKFLCTYTFYAMEKYLTHLWIMYYITRFLIIVVHWFKILFMDIWLVLMNYF
jgi:hypothetical protein